MFAGDAFGFVVADRVEDKQGRWSRRDAETQRKATPTALYSTAQGRAAHPGEKPLGERYAEGVTQSHGHFHQKKQGVICLTPLAYRSH